MQALAWVFLAVCWLIPGRPHRHARQLLAERRAGRAAGRWYRERGMLLALALLAALPAWAQDTDARARAFRESMLQQVPPAPIVGLAAVGPPPYSAFDDPANSRVSVYILGERQVVRYPMRDVPWTGTSESLDARYGPGYPGWGRTCAHIPHAGTGRQVMAREVLAWAGYTVTAQGAADLEATCPPLYAAYFAAHPLESGHGGEGVGVSCLNPRPYQRTPREVLRCRLFPLNGICREWTGWTEAYPECCPGVQCPVAQPPPPPPPPLPCDGGAPDGACTPREQEAGSCPEDCAPEPCGDGVCDFEERTSDSCPEDCGEQPAPSGCEALRLAVEEVCPR